MSDMTKPMAHQEAETMNAVDLYLLNELTEEQRRRFEEHYFDCATCAEAVEAGQTFVRSIRPAPEVVPWRNRVLGRLAKPMLVPAWRQWAYGGVTALSLIAVGWQHFYPIFASKARANTTIQARELEKGEDSEKAYTLRTPSATVELNLPSDAEFLCIAWSLKTTMRNPCCKLFWPRRASPTGGFPCKSLRSLLAAGALRLTWKDCTMLNPKMARRWDNTISS
jgi:hypothetical protein